MSIWSLFCNVYSSKYVQFGSIEQSFFPSNLYMSTRRIKWHQWHQQLSCEYKAIWCERCSPNTKENCGKERIIEGLMASREIRPRDQFSPIIVLRIECAKWVRTRFFIDIQNAVGSSSISDPTWKTAPLHVSNMPVVQTYVTRFYIFHSIKWEYCLIRVLYCFPDIWKSLGPNNVLYFCNTNVHNIGLSLVFIGIFWTNVVGDPSENVMEPLITIRMYIVPSMTRLRGSVPKEMSKFSSPFLFILHIQILVGNLHSLFTHVFDILYWR